MIDDKSYEDARKHIERRQSFLDGIDMEQYSPFVKGIKYHKGNISGGKFLMGVDSLPHFGRQSTIHVGNMAFEEFSPVEFYNSMVHHEGVHARQFYFNPSTIMDVGKFAIARVFKSQRKLVINRIKMEVEAYKNQMEHPSFSQCSFKRRKRIEQVLEYANNCHDEISRQIS